MDLEDLPESLKRTIDEGYDRIDTLREQIFELLRDYQTGHIPAYLGEVVEEADPIVESLDGAETDLNETSNESEKVEKGSPDEDTLHEQISRIHESIDTSEENLEDLREKIKEKTKSDEELEEPDEDEGDYDEDSDD